MNKTVCALLATLLLAPALSNLPAATAAEPARRNIVSPEVRADRTVTFRLLAPKVAQVVLNAEFGRQPMTKDDSGLWSVTVGPLDPDIYAYTFSVDGVTTVDPLNGLVKTGRSTQNLVEVPAASPAFYAPRNVPHGAVTVQWYHSKSLGKLRRMHVYTPPGYDQTRSTEFPVLYLLHGSGDDDSGWTWIGRANFIADNLIAEHKSKPMIIVMPAGHALPPPAPGEGKEHYGRNTVAFQDDLLKDITPFVELHYRVASGRERCALTGLSMGGGQSLAIGLTHLDRFAWIGAFSSGGGSLGGDPDKLLADAKEMNSKLRLLWIACGKQDFLYKINQEFDALLTSRQITHEFHATEGTHTWRLWRPHLRDFLQRLF
ncbi:MAG: alpha/beta hydrolase-fold protein [Verrucomicrobia bacterium]|nr:alpha/beta hydrolase-fold protein [Verrucomicrobiota bacterium]